MTLEQEIQRRRTFGIIAHPDAGKTTLTEKLLLFGGAIQTAGAVKSNKIDMGTTMLGANTIGNSKMNAKPGSFIQ